LQDKDGLTPLEIALKFNDKLISKKLVKILTRWKIPLVETGNENGTHILVSIFFGLFMIFLVCCYLALMYVSQEY